MILVAGTLQSFFILPFFLLLLAHGPRRSGLPWRLLGALLAATEADEAKCDVEAMQRQRHGNGMEYGQGRG